MMFNQHAALNMARQVYGEILREADRERQVAESRQRHAESGFGRFRRQIGAAMIRAGQRMQGLPRCQTDATLPAAH